jgi:hypothetical protein
LLKTIYKKLFLSSINS